ncbi:MAG: helix-turn-helix transcriptional regulator [Hungatella sp.]
MIVYDPLWATMKARNITQYRLIKNYGFSSGQISRLKNNMYVSTHTIGVLCTILDCSISDVMQFHLDESEQILPLCKPNEST